MEICDCDTALLAVLSHGLRAEEASQLDVQDYDGKRLHIREAKAGSTGRVPLDKDARAALNMYLEWRTHQGDFLGIDTPLFTNRSRDPRVQGRRLTYDGIYAIVKELGRLAVESAVSDDPGVADLGGWEIAALAEVHPHQLRHTFASNLVLGNYLKTGNPKHEQRIFGSRSCKEYSV